ncbi:NAD(P)-binding protein [Bacillus rubiinfantis]|uniref:NAD(P)-binding protein n=1 Tax=Bacillus rubiinfantis TaxID=1499680 RepID=UPI0005A9FBF8|nr:NAD(P)-binding protein [Bacillus rubiinfantis]
MQPLFIDLAGKKVVIIGGGKIAARKGSTLATEKPDLTFIAPEFHETVLQLSEEKGYQLIRRKAHYSDLSDAFLVILATNDRTFNKTWARQLSAHHLVCVVDEAEEGNVIFPATLRRGHLQIAVTTNGASPKLARKIKQELESQFDSTWENYLSFLAQSRRKLKKLPISLELRNSLLEELLEERYQLNEKLREELLARIDTLEKQNN